jgi:hypothetical protein
MKAALIIWSVFSDPIEKRRNYIRERERADDDDDDG